MTVTNSTGSVTERYRYDTYGVRTVLAGDEGTVLASSLMGNQVGFQGRFHEIETGLTYFRTRYESSKTGRFLNRNPWWENNGRITGNYWGGNIDSSSRKNILALSQNQVGSYFDGRTNLYDFEKNCPSDYVEPYSWPLLLLLLLLGGGEVGTEVGAGVVATELLVGGAEGAAIATEGAAATTTVAAATTTATSAATTSAASTTTALVLAAGAGVVATTPSGDSCSNDRPCKPCNPVKGSLLYEIAAPRVRGAHVGIDHVKYWKMGQNPNTCACFWNYDGSDDNTLIPSRGGQPGGPPNPASGPTLGGGR